MLYTYLRERSERSKVVKLTCASDFSIFQKTYKNRLKTHVNKLKTCASRSPHRSTRFCSGSHFQVTFFSQNFHPFWKIHLKRLGRLENQEMADVIILGKNVKFSGSPKGVSNDVRMAPGAWQRSLSPPLGSLESAPSHMERQKPGSFLAGNVDSAEPQPDRFLVISIENPNCVPSQKPSF